MSRQKCAECGKEFEIGPAGWGYGYGALYTCSYKCMREMERKDSTIMTDEEKKLVDELASAGKTTDEIVEKTGLKKMSVVTYMSRKKAKENNLIRPSGAPSPEGKAFGTGAAVKADTEQTEEKPQPAGTAREKVEMERYRVGWMCPMCRMVWSPWISACNCQRKEKK